MQPTTARSEPVIETPRLRLRPAEPRDIDPLLAELADFDVVKMLARVPYPYRRRDAEHFLAASAKAAGRDLHLSIFVDDRLIGGIGVTDIAGDCEFGYWFGRAHWGKGYATEAGRAVIEHTFANHAVDAIRSGAFVGNDASLRVQEKLGFEPVGRHMVHCLARGRAIEHIDTVLTRERFASP
ncbi:GNAT family N-acetyltransferase [Bauldia sp.]|uniref:GNAT family N-acetyltransferase n=1 Tax=Bauldia sp. TaxID=2575872 RepID=UPI003BACE348